MSSRELSRETRQRVSGGTTICSRCSEPRARGSAYCPTHRNEYQREWKRTMARKLRELIDFKRSVTSKSSGSVQ